MMIAFWGTTVSACSFTPEANIFKTPQENVSNYHYVISGMFSQVIPRGESFEGQDYQFTVYEVHKGDLQEETITLYSPGHSCGYFGQEGGEVLLFLDNTDSIDESVPKYFYDTREELLEVGRSLEAQSVSVSEVKSVTAPETCRVWFDGCNNCHRAAAGGPLACTKKACAVNDEPMCKEYMTGEDGLPYVEGPTSDPLDGFVGPTTPPPKQTEPEIVEEEERGWWQTIVGWVKGLFSK